MRPMTEDDPLRDLLDGNISAEELEAIRASPDLRKLALRMYGDSVLELLGDCLLYTSPSPRDGLLSRMPSSA